MKKIIISIVCISLFLPRIFAIEIPDNEKFNIENSPFKTSITKDSIAIGVLGATTIYSLMLPKIIDMPKYNEFSYDINDVNFIDRKFAKKYNKKIDFAGDLSLAFSYCLIPGIYGTEYLFNNFDFNEGIKLAVIYTETVLATETTKCLLKTAIKRKRPYMYFEGYPENELDNYDFEFSFPSGHTTSSFMNATFLSYTFCKYYPESNYKIPIIAGAYSIATTTACLRMASGNHFLTDVISGAALGTTIGFVIPWLHTFGEKISSKDTQVTLTPFSTSITFKF